MSGKSAAEKNLRVLGLILCVVFLATISLSAPKKPKKKTPLAATLSDNLVYQTVSLSQFATPAPDNSADKEVRIVLQNTSNEPASCSVWFDGIKLEKAQNEFQEYPTSYHIRSNLLSPEFTATLEGGLNYYEW